MAVLGFYPKNMKKLSFVATVLLSLFIFSVFVPSAHAKSPKVILTWNASTSSDVVKYKIYKKTDENGSWSSAIREISSQQELKFVDADVQPSTTYFYAVTAVNEAGSESDPNQAKIKVDVGTEPPADNPPQITEFSVPSVAQTGAGVDFSANATGSITTYSWNLGDGTTKTGKSITHTFSSAGNYTVSLTVTDANGATDTKSQTITVTEPPQENTPPTTPGSPSATAISSTQIDISWSPSTDSDGNLAGYKIYRSGLSTPMTSSSTSFSDTGLSPSTSYSYKISAYDAAGAESTKTSSISATTQSQSACQYSCTPWSPSECPQSGTQTRTCTKTTTDCVSQNPPDETRSCEPPVQCNNNGICETSSGENTTNCPADCRTNSLPTASIHAVPTSGDYPLLVTFSGANSSDPDGDQLYFSWNLGDGTIKDEKSFTHTFTTAGTRTVHLTVTDGKGVDIASTKIVVTNPSGGGGGGGDSTPPEIQNLTKTTTQTTAKIEFSTNEIATVRILYGPTRNYGKAKSSELKTDFDFDFVGLVADTQYFYKIEATDKTGNRSMQEGSFRTKQSTDADQLLPPADLTATTVSAFQINLEWQAPSGNVSGYKLFRDDEFIASTAQLSYRDIGLDPKTTYRYRVSAYNTSTESGRSEEAVATTSSPPGENSPPSASIFANEIFGTAPFTTSFTANANDSDGTISLYQWDFQNDGTIDESGSDLSVVSHTFQSAGTYTIKLIVTDNDGGTATATKEVQVETGVDTQNPTTPENLTATISGAQADLSWDAATDNVGVVGYRIFRDGNVIGASEQTSYSDSNLPSGTTFKYQVSAYDAASLESGKSNIAVVKTAGPPADIEAPSTPGGLRATSEQYNRVVISWNESTDNVGVVGYKIIRDGVQIREVSNENVSYPDTNVRPNKTYRYRVSAVDAAGNESGSFTVVAHTPSKPTIDKTPPSIPNAVSVRATSSSKIRIQWQASRDNVGVGEYQIFDKSGNQIAQTVKTYYSHSGLSPATKYCFRVAAADDSGNVSAKTSAKCARTHASDEKITAPKRQRKLSSWWMKMVNRLRGKNSDSNYDDLVVNNNQNDDDNDDSGSGDDDDSEHSSAPNERKSFFDAFRDRLRKTFYKREKTEPATRRPRDVTPRKTSKKQSQPKKTESLRERLERFRNMQKNR